MTTSPDVLTEIEAWYSAFDVQHDANGTGPSVAEIMVGRLLAMVREMREALVFKDTVNKSLQDRIESQDKLKAQLTAETLRADCATAEAALTFGAAETVVGMFYDCLDEVGIFTGNPQILAAPINALDDVIQTPSLATAMLARLAGMKEALKPFAIFARGVESVDAHPDAQPISQCVVDGKLVSLTIKNIRCAAEAAKELG